MHTPTYKTKVIVTGLALVLLPVLSLLAVNQFPSLSNKATAGYGGLPGIQYKHIFSTELLGSNEVPPISTATTGDAFFNVRESEREIDFAVNVYNGANITAAHLHCAPAGQNGPVVVGLFDGFVANITGELVSGTLTEANILAAGSTCSPNITTMPHLVQAMREGRIYVNVHSTQHPNGEIRGQLSLTGSGVPIGTPVTPAPTPTPPTPGNKHTVNVNLHGTNVNPMVTTSTTGNATFNVSNDEQTITYQVFVQNGTGITEARLNCAPTGNNGPQVVDPLFTSAGTNVNGLLASGSVTSANLLAAAATCSPNITTMSHLVQAMREGRIYLIIDSTSHPDGLIRGQVVI